VQLDFAPGTIAESGNSPVLPLIGRGTHCKTSHGAQNILANGFDAVQSNVMGPKRFRKQYAQGRRCDVHHIRPRERGFRTRVTVDACFAPSLDQ